MPPLSGGFQLLRIARRVRVKRLQAFNRFQSTLGGRSRDNIFEVSEEVRDAIETGKPVVALETTIYTHGLYFANPLLCW